MIRRLSIAIFLLSMPVLAVWGGLTLVYGQSIEPDDLDFSLPACLTNSTGSALTHSPFPATINADEMSSGGFTQNSFADLVAVTGNGEEVGLLAQDVTSTSATWWVEADAISDGQTRCWEIHMGGAVSNPQRMVLTATDTVTVSDAASLDIDDDLTMESLGTVLRTLPGSEVCLVCKEDAYELVVNSTTVTARISFEDGGSEFEFPNATGSTANLTANGCAQNWDCMDSQDSDTSYVSQSSGGATAIDYYNFADITIPGTLVSVDTVDVSINARHTGSCGATTPQVGGRIRIDGDETIPSAQNITLDVYAQYDFTGLAKPGGGTWTEQDLNDLEIGLSLRSGSSCDARATAMFVQIAYTYIDTAEVSHSPIAVDTEYDFRATHDGSTLRLYVDGTEEASTALAESIATNANDVTVSGITGWLGSTTVHDSSGTQSDETANGNDGTVSGGALGVTGQLGGALFFDGASGQNQDDMVTISDAASIQNIWDGGGTIESWICPEGVGEGNFGRFLSKGWFADVRTLSGGNVQILFLMDFDGTDGHWRTASDIPTDECTHVAITYNADSASNDPTIYTTTEAGVTTARTVGNGLSETSTPTGTRVSDVGQDLIIGNSSSGTNTFDGTIDDPRVWDDIRTQQEVEDNHASELTGSEANLAAYLPLDNRVLDLQYEPAQCSQTQAGNAGNGWVWTGDITDQSASNNDATYTFTRTYVEDVTVELQPLISKEPLPTVLVVEDLEDVVGTLPDLDTPAGAGVNFPGRDGIQEVIDFMGGPDGAVWFGYLAAAGIVLGGLAIGKSKQPFIGLWVLGTVVFLGGPFELYSWGLVTLACMACFGAGGAMAYANVRGRA